jgi:hypothetical protein
MLLEVELHPPRYKRKGESRQLRLLPDSHVNSLNSNTNLVGLRLDLHFFSLCIELRRMASIYRGNMEKWRTFPSFLGPNRPPRWWAHVNNALYGNGGSERKNRVKTGS